MSCENYILIVEIDRVLVGFLLSNHFIFHNFAHAAGKNGETKHKKGRLNCA